MRIGNEVLKRLIEKGHQMANQDSDSLYEIDNDESGKILETVDKIARITNIIFYILMFGFLAAWVFIALKTNNKDMALLSIPFWILGIIKVIRRRR